MIQTAKHKVQNLVQRLREDKAVGQALIALVLRTLAAGLAYLFQIYLANALKIDAYGVFVTFWTWQIIISKITVLGYQESAVRFLPRYHSRNQQHVLANFVRHGARMTILASGSIALLGAVLIWVLGDSINADYVGPALVVALGLPIIALEVYLEGVNRGLGWFMLSLLPVYILRPILVIAAMLILGHSGFALDAKVALAVMIGVSAALVIGQAIIMAKKIRPKIPQAIKIKKKRLHRSWLFATLPLVIVSGVDEMFYWSDIVVLGLIAEPADVSVYFAAVRCMAFASFIHYGFMLVFAREFSLANTEGDVKELSSRVSMASTWTFWLTIPTVILIVAAGPILLSFFGEEFGEGIFVMVLIGIGAIGKGSVGPASNLLIVLGKEKRDVAISAISLLSNITVSVLLVPFLGIVGAAIATAASQLVRALLLARYCRIELGLDVTTSLDPRSLSAAKSSRRNLGS